MRFVYLIAAAATSRRHGIFIVKFEARRVGTRCQSAAALYLLVELVELGARRLDQFLIVFIILKQSLQRSAGIVQVAFFC